MTTNVQRSVVRAALLAVLLHAIIAAVAIVVKNALWGSEASHRATQLLRLIDLPVLWAVDPTLQRVPLLPPAAAFERLWVAASANEILVYGIFGGAFYAGVAAAIVFARRRRRERTAEASS